MKPRLTDREVEIIRGLWTGKTQRELAYGLKCSVKTVEAHTASIRKKLHVRNRTETLRKAIEMGIIRPKKVA